MTQEITKEFSPSPTERVEHYKSAIEILEELKKTGRTRGICIILGDIGYGKYFICPWVGWDDGSTYYPEMEKVKPPIERLPELYDAREVTRVRIQVLKELIAAVPSEVNPSPGSQPADEGHSTDDGQ